MSQYFTTVANVAGQVLTTTRANMLHQAAGRFRMFALPLLLLISTDPDSAKDLFKSCPSLAGYWRHAKGQKDISEGSLEIRRVNPNTTGSGRQSKR